ncbi:uncharacterized protein MONOS_12620 [Monocercomonoides exilis]|uniref:uncharacterized protein n=1 Tax=Monocercomonoides exilis TaxID=2049356 RepID=UPI00355A4A42|nr:hypothetical protein MONOS_12620 [Monocercomonoides exilis]|eukprot:MONOS_12620.1-p1 / transcript=MONOS_12620.1 / gene=MONOS_12620 / organism=Monocercomonoides_exilis_PA203 / gene_product=unspecified product / transcript_product=unspecified product / location=Mono_scaffold00710:15859-16891(+) / protein_length=194 / sequence_SO=supercontig / SO=protein_coding / is_pseudo=false
MGGGLSHSGGSTSSIATVSSGSITVSSTNTYTSAFVDSVSSSSTSGLSNYRYSPLSTESSLPSSIMAFMQPSSSSSSTSSVSEYGPVSATPFSAQSEQFRGMCFHSTRFQWELRDQTTQSVDVSAEKIDKMRRLSSEFSDSLDRRIGASSALALLNDPERDTEMQTETAQRYFDHVKEKKAKQRELNSDEVLL